jgi:AcrR family transcriptional regulator
MSTGAPVGSMLGERPDGDGNPDGGAPADGRVRRGMRNRQAILERAVQLASREGLTGLTIGRLADELGLSKSGVFAQFGSKEELQLATVEAARRMLIGLVVQPGLDAPDGLARLRALGDAWFHYLGSGAFEGGCFFCAASAELDDRRGPVRDEVAGVMRRWLELLEATIAAAVRAGELPPDIDAPELAFGLHALGMAANWQLRLLDDRSALEHGRRGWARELDAVAAGA